MTARRSTSLWTKFHWLVLPQLLLLAFLVSYLLTGAFIFRLLDGQLANATLEDVIVFEVSALATIGYGNIAPQTTSARAFCIGFSIIGIPLFLLALANLGKYARKVFWLGLSGLRGRRSLGALRGDALPLPVSAALFALLVLVGARGMKHNGDGSIVDDVYFSFISFATVGFGDKVPVVDTTLRFMYTMTFLVVGLFAISSIFTSFNYYLRKIHHIGRRFRGARDVQVWMGGRSIPVSKLLEIVGSEFDASPREIREVLRDLDCLILSVMEKQREDEEARRKPLEESHLIPPIAKDIEDFDVYE